MKVDRIRTPVPLDELIELIDQTGHEVLGWCPGDARCVAWAQLVHEHGRTEPQAAERVSLRGIWNYNFGNRDAPGSAVGAPDVQVFVSVREREVKPDGSEYYTEHLRYAYPDAYTGLCAWWESMRVRWEAIGEMQDPVAFARQLKSKGYYTGSEQVYAARLTEYAAEAAKMWADAH